MKRVLKLLVLTIIITSCEVGGADEFPVPCGGYGADYTWEVTMCLTPGVAEKYDTIPFYKTVVHENIMYYKTDSTIRINGYERCYKICTDTGFYYMCGEEDFEIEEDGKTVGKKIKRVL